MNFNWTQDDYDCFNLYIEHDGHRLHLFVQARPAYCDRGHYSFNIDGPGLNLDGADSFPRYYMTLARALREATEWIVWRLYKIPGGCGNTEITVTFRDGKVVEVE
jgi:hypothetical protein